jgi:hypothetical protein
LEELTDGAHWEKKALEIVHEVLEAMPKESAKLAWGVLV